MRRCSGGSRGTKREPLTLAFHIGDSGSKANGGRSKENDDRLEAKIDELIRMHGGDKGDALIERIDRDFLRHGGHSKPFGHAR